MIGRPLTLSALSLLLASAMADATPTYCSAGMPQADGLSLSDVTFRGSSADDCFGVQLGNDTGAQAAFIGWNGFDLLLSDAAGDSAGDSTTWMGVDWSLAGATSATAGQYSLSWSDPSLSILPLGLDIVVVTKGSNRFASYLFTNELFGADSGSSSGTWQIPYTNNGGQIPNLAHLSIWARLDPSPVSEPGTLSLLTLGLAGMCAVVLRRRRRAALT